MSLEVPSSIFFLAGIAKATVDVSKLLLKYLDETGKVAVLTRRGMCRVCGRFHTREDEWRECAERRMRRDRGEYRGQQRIYFFPKEREELYNPLPRYKIELEIKIDPVIVCSFPREEDVQWWMDKGQKALYEWKTFLSKVIDALELKLGEIYRRKVITHLEKKGLKTPHILRGKPEDVLFSAIIQMLLERPDLARIESGTTLVLDSDFEFDLKIVGSRGSPYLHYLLSVWLAKKSGVSSVKMIDERTAILKAVDRCRKVGLLSVVKPWRTSYTEYFFEVDLRDYRILREIPKSEVEKWIETAQSHSLSQEERMLTS